MTDRKAEHDVTAELSGVHSAVKKAKLDGAFCEGTMKVKAIMFS